MGVVEGVEEVNEKEKRTLFEKVEGELKGDLGDKRIGLWGLGLKGEREEMGEGGWVIVIEKLVNGGCKVGV